MSGPLLLPTWEQLAARPQIVDTMSRYLEQIACVLRPGSVNNTDQALRAFAGFLLETAPEVTTTAQVTRRHIENFKPWLTATAPDHPNSTAPSNRSVKPARSSRPASSSDPPSKPNTTTPQPKVKTTEPTSSASTSTASKTVKHHEQPRPSSRA